MSAVVRTLGSMPCYYGIELKKGEVYVSAALVLSSHCKGCTCLTMQGVSFLTPTDSLN